MRVAASKFVNLSCKISSLFLSRLITSDCLIAHLVINRSANSMWSHEQYKFNTFLIGWFWEECQNENVNNMCVWWGVGTVHRSNVDTISTKKATKNRKQLETCQYNISSSRLNEINGLSSNFAATESIEPLYSMAIHELHWHLMN